MIWLALVLVLIYLAVAGSLIGPVRRIGFTEFGAVYGWLGGLIVALQWPLAYLMLLRRDFLLHVLRSNK